MEKREDKKIGRQRYIRRGRESRSSKREERNERDEERGKEWEKEK